MSQKGKICIGKPRNRWVYVAEYDLKKMGVTDFEKNNYGYRRLEIDPERGQVTAWNVDPMEKSASRPSRFNRRKELLYQLNR